jgi:hypothetical protein
VGKPTCTLQTQWPQVMGGGGWHANMDFGYFVSNHFIDPQPPALTVYGGFQTHRTLTQAIGQPSRTILATETTWSALAGHSGDTPAGWQAASGLCPLRHGAKTGYPLGLTAADYVGRVKYGVGMSVLFVDYHVDFVSGEEMHKWITARSPRNAPFCWD